MTVLLLFCLPLIFFSYVFQLEAKSKHIFIFFAGIAVTALSLLLVPLFFAETARYIDTLGSYFFYFFFTDTFIPLCIVLPVALLLSGFNISTMPSALFGFFTAKIYQQLFLTSAHLRIMPIVLCILMYTGAVFILNALLHFSNSITFYYILTCILCFLLFIAVLIAGTFALGMYYFKSSPIIYGSILAGITLTGSILHFMLYRHGNLD